VPHYCFVPSFDNCDHGTIRAFCKTISILTRRGLPYTSNKCIKEIVEPLSRSILVDDTDPDYPPICYAYDEAHRQGAPFPLLQAFLWHR
jgi:hypothetical protein